MMIKTTPKVEKNRPEIVILGKKEMQCRIIEVTVPLDKNLKKAGNEKQVKDIELISRMHNL